MRWITRLAVSIVVVAGAVFWARESDFATSTRYCPWNHRVGFAPWVCKVKDMQGGKVLVEHADLDVNRMELSIYDNGRVRWIQHPDGHVTKFSNRLDENTIRFDQPNSSFLVVNKERFPITELQSEPAP